MLEYWFKCFVFGTVVLVTLTFLFYGVAIFIEAVDDWKSVAAVFGYLFLFGVFAIGVGSTILYLLGGVSF